MVQHIGCECSWAFPLSSLRTSTDWGCWWPQTRPSGYIISVARCSTPPYSSIRPSADWGCWGLNSPLKGLESLSCSNGSPIPYKTMCTESVTLKPMCIYYIFVMHVSHILDCLVIDIVDFFLHHWNGSYSFTLVLFQF